MEHAIRFFNAIDTAITKVAPDGSMVYPHPPKDTPDGVFFIKLPDGRAVTVTVRESDASETFVGADGR